MNRVMKILLLASSIVTSAVWAADDETRGITLETDGLTVGVGGFINGDYGFGDRYGDLAGEDRLGVSQAALAISAKHQDVSGVFVVGTEGLTGGGASDDGDVDIKDAFIVIDDLGYEGFSVSAGLQPLMFGLKPAGYPGDRSLQPSLEYGAAGSFAVAQQAGPSIIGNFEVSDRFSLRFGAFDSNEVAIIDDSGSSLTDNYFAQLRLGANGDSGFYGSLGYESVYVGTTTVGAEIDDSKEVWGGGIGFSHPKFDLSAEYYSVDAEIAGLTDDDELLVAQLTYNMLARTRSYVDWSKSMERDVETIRAGVQYSYSQHLAFAVEFADDMITNGDDVGSVDMRLHMTF